MSLKVRFEVAMESCPLQIFGEVNGVGFYYRARFHCFQVWLNSDGEVSREWLERNDNLNPTVTGTILGEDEDNVVEALQHILSAVLDS